MFLPPLRSLIPHLLAHTVYTRVHMLGGGTPVSLTAAQWRNTAPHQAGLRLALRPLLAVLLPALAALLLFAPHVSAEPESAVWSATLTVADQQHSLLGCQSAVPVGRCDDALVLTEDEVAYGDVRARVLSLVWDREANAVIVRLDMDWTQMQRDLRLYVDGLALSLDNAEYLADQLDSDRARWLLSNIGVASLDWSAGDTVRLRLANRPANSAVAPAASTGSTYDPPPSSYDPPPPTYQPPPSSYQPLPGSDQPPVLPDQSSAESPAAEGEPPPSYDPSSPNYQPPPPSYDPPPPTYQPL